MEPPLLLEDELRRSRVPPRSARSGHADWVARSPRRAGLDVAAYYWRVRNEIPTHTSLFPGAPFTIPSYRNVDHSRHAGLELGGDLLLVDSPDHGRLSWRMAYTLSRFRFQDDPVFGNNDLPGAPRHLVRSEVRFQRSPGYWVAPAVDWSPSSYFVDSANTTTNDSYTVLNVRGGYDWRRLGLYLEAANVTDRRYSVRSWWTTRSAGTTSGEWRSFYAGLRGSPWRGLRRSRKAADNLGELLPFFFRGLRGGRWIPRVMGHPGGISISRASLRSIVLWIHSLRRALRGLARNAVLGTPQSQFGEQRGSSRSRNSWLGIHEGKHNEPAIKRSETARADISVRSLQESDLSTADQSCGGFRHFLGLPDPASFAGDASYVRTRWTASRMRFRREIKAEVVGSNFATNWGSVGFFGR